MRTKPLGVTSQKVLLFLYVMKRPCKRFEIVHAVNDSTKKVADSLQTLSKLELIVQLERGLYKLAEDISLTSRLDMAMYDINIQSIVERIRRLSNIVYIGNTQYTDIATLSHTTAKAIVPNSIATITQDTVVSLLLDSKQKAEDISVSSSSVCNVGGVGGEEIDAYLGKTEMTGAVDVFAILTSICPDQASLDEKEPEFTACCPMHGEKTPSFGYNLVEDTFNCFGCDLHGRGIFSLLDKLGYDGEELLDFAYDYSLDIAPDEERIAKVAERRSQYVERVDESKRQYANEMIQVRDWYAHGFGGANVVDTWIDGKQTPERDYLFERGILPTALQHFKAAVFLNIPHHRIYFPLALNGCVHGYQRRGIKESKHTPKYLTMTGMDKSVHVYGDVVGDTVLVCEGITDLLVGYQRGVTSIVATLGAIVSDEQCYELFSLGIKHVIHAAHPDHAGDSAFLFGRMAFAKFGIESKRLILTTDIADSRRDDFLMAYEKVATSFQRV